jgi:predicted RNA binding protein YcfA (HicA-like mRNA interferase family)
MYRSADGVRRVVVAHHGSRVVPSGTVANILRQAGISDEEFRDLLKG